MEWRYGSTHLNSTLAGGEQSASRLSSLVPAERAPPTHYTGGLVVSRAGTVLKRNISALPRNKTRSAHWLRHPSSRHSVSTEQTHENVWVMTNYAAFPNSRTGNRVETKNTPRETSFYVNFRQHTWADRLLSNTQVGSLTSLVRETCFSTRENGSLTFTIDRASDGQTDASQDARRWHTLHSNTTPSIHSQSASRPFFFTTKLCDAALTSNETRIEILFYKCI